MEIPQELFLAFYGALTAISVQGFKFLQDKLKISWLTPRQTLSILCFCFGGIYALVVYGVADPGELFNQTVISSAYLWCFASGAYAASKLPKK